MTLGPKKYDELCNYVLNITEGRAAVVVIVEDNKAGMGVKSEFALCGGKFVIRQLPKLLRDIAKEIEENDL